MSEVSFLLGNLGPIERHLAMARHAAEAGARRLWVPETRGPDALVTAAVMAQVTKVEVGTAIVPTSTRTPAVLAMAAADLTRLSGRAAHLGLGAGGQAIVERWHGQPFGRSVERMADTLAILRQALSGATTDHAGTVLSSHGFSLAAAPAAPVRLHLGGAGPRMVELAGRLADGLILTWNTAEVARRQVAELGRIAREVGRPQPAALVARLYVAVGEDRSRVREGVRRELVSYLTSPPYQRYFTSMGFGAEAEGVAAAFRAGDRRASVAAVSDAMVDALVVVGPPGECRDRIEELFSAGAAEVMVQPVPEDRGGDPAATVATVASLFRPR